MKTCKKCGVSKDESEFYRRKLTRQGNPTNATRGSCKACRVKEAHIWVKENPARRAEHDRKRRRVHAVGERERIRKWNRENAAKASATKAAWKRDNAAQVKQKNAEWQKNNPGKISLSNARHRATKLKATPPWANEFYIAEIYDLCQRRSKCTGVPHQVDHIVPLRSKLVCGLHCEDNLRVIPAPINASKGNRHWPDMPEVRM